MPIIGRCMDASPGIAREEYERRRTAFELAVWVNEKFRMLETSDQFERNYFERIGENVKPFIEEVIPVSRLALHLAIPGKDVFVRCFSDNRPYDAELELGSDGETRFRVEVTTTEESPDSTMRRQALSRNGIVSLTGTLRREGRSVSDEPRAVDVAEETDRQIQLALSRLQRKAERARYGNDTAILVYLTDCWVWPLHDLRAELMRRADHYVETAQPNIYAAYFCYFLDHSIDGISVRRPGQVQRTDQRGADRW